MLNKCDFIGRLGKDVEARYLPSGDPVSTFSLAATEKYTNKDGEKKENTEWIKCVCFGKLAKLAGEYLGKGSLVYVSGKMHTRSWDAPSGEKKYSTEIVLKEIVFLSPKKEKDPESMDEMELRGPDDMGDQPPF